MRILPTVVLTAILMPVTVILPIISGLITAFRAVLSRIRTVLHYHNRLVKHWH